MHNHFETRSRIVGVIGFAIGAMLAVIWFFASESSSKPSLHAEASHPIREESETLSDEDEFDPTVADPSYSPEDVVRLQLASIQAAAENPEKLIVCYSLASPGNRKITGPFDRFAELTRVESYRPLLGHQTAMIGRANVNEEQAAVMATVIAEDGRAYAFQFILSRHHPTDSEPGSEIAAVGTVDERQPADDSGICWMTDGVYPVFVADVSPVSASPTTK